MKTELLEVEINREGTPGRGMCLSKGIGMGKQ